MTSKFDVLRSRDELRPASVMADGSVMLDEPALPAPGQPCVFYRGERVLGGGFLQSHSAT